MKKENLNKENFWNELYAKYPKGVKFFCDWIDQYKKENNWKYLFRNDHVRFEKDYIKFHDIPLAMQIGIYIEFVSLYPTAHEWEIEDLNAFDWKEDIYQFMKMLHEQDDCREAFEDALKQIA